MVGLQIHPIVCTYLFYSVPFVEKTIPSPSNGLVSLLEIDSSSIFYMVTSFYTVNFFNSSSEIWSLGYGKLDNSKIFKIQQFTNLTSP